MACSVCTARGVLHGSGVGTYISVITILPKITPHYRNMKKSFYSIFFALPEIVGINGVNRLSNSIFTFNMRVVTVGAQGYTVDMAVKYSMKL